MDIDNDETFSMSLSMWKRGEAKAYGTVQPDTFGCATHKSKHALWNCSRCISMSTALSGFSAQSNFLQTGRADIINECHTFCCQKTFTLFSERKLRHQEMCMNIVAQNPATVLYKKYAVLLTLLVQLFFHFSAKKYREKKTEIVNVFLSLFSIDI